MTHPNYIGNRRRDYSQLPEATFQFASAPNIFALFGMSILVGVFGLLLVGYSPSFIRNSVFSTLIFLVVFYASMAQIWELLSKKITFRFSGGKLIVTAQRKWPFKVTTTNYDLNDDVQTLRVSATDNVNVYLELIVWNDARRHLYKGNIAGIMGMGYVRQYIPEKDNND